MVRRAICIAQHIRIFNNLISFQNIRTLCAPNLSPGDPWKQESPSRYYGIRKIEVGGINVISLEENRWRAVTKVLSSYPPNELRKYSRALRQAADINRDNMESSFFVAD